MSDQCAWRTQHCLITWFAGEHAMQDARRKTAEQVIAYYSNGEYRLCNELEVKAPNKFSQFNPILPNVKPNFFHNFNPNFGKFAHPALKLTNYGRTRDMLSPLSLLPAAYTHNTGGEVTYTSRPVQQQGGCLSRQRRYKVRTHFKEFHRVVDIAFHAADHPLVWTTSWRVLPIIHCRMLRTCHGNRVNSIS